MPEGVKTICGMCTIGCGMEVYLQKGEISKIKGLQQHPVNKGILCPKPGALKEFVYSPDRIKRPLKRRGDGWEELSWEKALDHITENLMEVKERYGPQALSAGLTGGFGL